jgi:hypothetical protein
MSDCNAVQFVPTLKVEGARFDTHWVSIRQCRPAWNTADNAQLRSVCYIEKVIYNHLKNPRTVFNIS